MFRSAKSASRSVVTDDSSAVIIPVVSHHQVSLFFRCRPWAFKSRRRYLRRCPSGPVTQRRCRWTYSLQTPSIHRGLLFRLLRQYLLVDIIGPVTFTISTDFFHRLCGYPPPAERPPLAAISCRWLWGANKSTSPRLKGFPG